MLSVGQLAVPERAANLHTAFFTSRSGDGQRKPSRIATLRRVTIDELAFYEAVRSRDTRFEGRFVIGVKTTEIYCRPGCPARTPRRENVRFFASSAAAESEGFRACRRCRPDRGVDASAWGRKSSTVAHALRLIEYATTSVSVEDIALHAGVTGRHLRRLFESELGASPATIQRCKRLRFARQLLEESALPMTQVAQQAGFASVRRFNSAIRATYRATPSELRRQGGGDRLGLALRLPYRRPYAWSQMLQFLGARALPGVETVTTSSWSRRLSEGAIEVLHDAPASALLLRIEGPTSLALLPLVSRVRQLFDLDADPVSIDACLADDPRLSNSVARAPGVRVPGAFDRFELLVRTVLGQQISVAAATTIAGRLQDRGCMESRSLAAADPRTLGLPLKRAEVLVALAARVCCAELDLSRPLPALPGLGPWSRAYYAMRALGDCDAFPEGDLLLEPHRARSEGWRPWRAYAAMRLWLEEKD